MVPQYSGSTSSQITVPRPNNSSMVQWCINLFIGSKYTVMTVKISVLLLYATFNVKSELFTVSSERILYMMAEVGCLRPTSGCVSSYFPLSSLPFSLDDYQIDDLFRV